MKKRTGSPNKSSISVFFKDESGYALVILAAIITFIVGLIIIAKFGNIFVAPKKPDTPPVNIFTKQINAYYSDVDGLMLAEEKHTIKKGTAEEEVRDALLTIMGKPANKNFESTIPPGTRLLSIAIKGKLLTANFSKELVKNHPGGSSAEIQTVFAIVNTVALNFPQFKEVQILVEGKRVDTIAGHIDISMPLEPDRSTIGLQNAKS